MKLLLFLPALRSGGAERVMAILASAWARGGHDVILATINPGKDFYSLDEKVTRVRLDLPGATIPFFGSMVSFIRKQGAIRKTIQSTKPEIIVSFLNRLNVRVLLAVCGLSVRGLGVPIIISERIAPEKTGAGLGWRILRRLTYPLADLLIAQTEREAMWFKSFTKQQMVIPNPVPNEAFTYRQIKKTTKAPLSIVAMGRLVRQKGFDMLIAAFARAKDGMPDCTLTIYGEGEQRAFLENEIKNLGLEGCARLPGVTETPYQILADADMFVLSSRFEGFPNALVEAMAAGVPVVAFDCPNGPREIIEHGKTGLLAAEAHIDSLSKNMQAIASDPDGARRFGAEARESVRLRFSLKATLENWDVAFRTVLK